MIYDCIVVGGGISGITFAHCLKKRGIRVMITEKEDVFGGQISTFCPQGNDGFWLETGAHTCYNSYIRLLAMAAETGAAEHIVPIHSYGYKLLKNNEIRSLTSAISYLPLLTNCFKIAGADKHGKTTREYYSPIVGKINYDNVFRYAFRAVISQDADDYPAEIFLKKRKTRDKSRQRNFTFERGLSGFLKTIVWSNGLEIRCKTEIKRISKDGDVFVLTDAGGVQLRTKNIAMATDPQTAASLLKRVEPDLAGVFSTVGVVRSESVGVIVPANVLNVKKMSGLIPQSDELLSVVSRDVIPDKVFRGFTFHFSDEQKSETEQFDLICKVLHIKRSDIQAWTTTKHRLPALRREHIDMANRSLPLRKDAHIFLTGNYFYGLSLEDCVIRAEREASAFFAAN